MTKRKTRTGKRLKTDCYCCNTRNQLQHNGKYCQYCTFNTTINPIAMLYQFKKKPCILFKESIENVLVEYEHEKESVEYQILQVC